MYLISNHISIFGFFLSFRGKYSLSTLELMQILSPKKREVEAGSPFQILVVEYKQSQVLNDEIDPLTI